MHTQTRPTHIRKRTHLKPSQVAVLQESFVTNSLPDTAIRSRLARELDVSERTIQIWFQNRRAKARKLEANSDGRALLLPNVRTGWIESPMAKSSPRYQPTFRALLTPERYEEASSLKKHRSQRAVSTHYDTTQHTDLSTSLSPARAMSEGAKCQALHSTTTAIMPVNALQIGTWTRYLSSTYCREWDLQCFCLPLERLFVWQVQDNGHFFRMTIAFDNVRQIRLVQSQENQQEGQLELDVDHVDFSMCQKQLQSQGYDEETWIRCGDFSESQQASIDPMHMLKTHNFDALKQNFSALMSLIPDLSAKCVTHNPVTAFDNLMQSDISISPSSTPEPRSCYFSTPSSVVSAGPSFPHFISSNSDSRKIQPSIHNLAILDEIQSYYLLQDQSLYL
ncbi:homeobox-domain-containing protein [Hesseltinella vesiculosa]|uniref:Homeobox-domain-containing protein n=1 Tax=Hesseltinella vesiculosa TaxID=101127 RepID=A0A1X2G6H2_9FUNG|nr:homeobox-domain-containing protein [Hesseltinella vesiculosa]